MPLVICVSCGHPANEHSAYGCADLVDELDAEGYPGVCPCERSSLEVYRQHVPPLEPTARAGEGSEP